MTFLCKPSLTCTESGFVLLALVSVKVLLSIRNLIARIRCLFTFHQPGAGLTIRTCKRICKLWQGTHATAKHCYRAASTFATVFYYWQLDWISMSFSRGKTVFWVYHCIPIYRYIIPLYQLYRYTTLEYAILNNLTYVSHIVKKPGLASDRKRYAQPDRLDIMVMLQQLVR